MGMKDQNNPCKPVKIREYTDAEKKADLNEFFAAQRKERAERKEFAKLAPHAMKRLCRAMAQQTGQSYKLRDLIYSLWNGQRASLLEVVELDWGIRQDLTTVILAFGYEALPKSMDENDPSFFYDAIKAAVVEAGLWDWFCEAHKHFDR